jgi:hypothetical protein
MIKLFRKIRQQLLTENKFSKYMLYAIGEIILVVIGILIALSVNNWNNNLQQQEKLTDDYNSILKEISLVNSIVEKSIKRNDSTLVKTKKALRLLQSRNTDSIHQLEYNLSGFMRLSVFQFDLPITMSFIESDNTKKLKNETLKKTLYSLKSQTTFLTFFQTFAANEYQMLIEPYVAKNFNFAKIKKLNNDYAIDVNHTIDYVSFFNDIELANLLNLKMESDITGSKKLNELNKTLSNLKIEITKELEKK